MLGPGAVTTCDKIGAICELEGSGSQEFSPWSLSNISGSMTALLWERLPEAGRGSEQDWGYYFPEKETEAQVGEGWY